MKRALSCAKKAAKIGEVPVGAVVVRNGEVVSTGYNRRETDKNALRHAEITAIDRACKKLGGWRLWECDLYVTLEPCPMCAGAIAMSGISRLIYGAVDAQYGCAGSVYRITEDPAFHSYCPADGGLFENECARLLEDFFRKRR